jgi:hypothetical protein
MKRSGAAAPLLETIRNRAVPVQRPGDDDCQDLARSDAADRNRCAAAQQGR